MGLEGKERAGGSLPQVTGIRIELLSPGKAGQSGDLSPQGPARPALPPNGTRRARTLGVTHPQGPVRLQSILHLPKGPGLTCAIRARGAGRKPVGS